MSQLILERTHTTGETVRGTVQSADLDRVLEKLRQQRARLISVTPVNRTLEDYFLAKTQREKEEGRSFPMTSRAFRHHIEHIPRSRAGPRPL